MDGTRRLILKIHGSFLLVLGLVNAILSTVGALWDVGPLSYLYTQRIGHVGLLQAYLLAALLGAVLLLGARQPAAVVWDWIGMLVHLAILSVYVLYWDFFPQVAPGFEVVRSVALLHIGLALLEAWAIFGRAGKIGVPRMRQSSVQSN